MSLPEIQPILKWPGGKRSIAEQIRRCFDGPLPIGRRYYEPFAGSLAVYLHRYAMGEIQPKMAVLSDANPRLISFYWALRQCPVRIYDALMRLPHQEGWKSSFNTLRDDLNLLNTDSFSAEHAALYLWYNRACFNGLMRVNSSDQLNAPCGDYDALSLPSLKDLERVSKALDGTILEATSFDKQAPQQGDQVYLDPPYQGMFDQYTWDRFPYIQQVNLAVWTAYRAERGAFIVLSNSNDPKVRTIYEGLKFDIREINAAQSISCKGDGRGQRGELLVIAK